MKLWLRILWFRLTKDCFKAKMPKYPRQGKVIFPGGEKAFYIGGQWFYKIHEDPEDRVATQENISKFMESRKNPSKLS